MPEFDACRSTNKLPDEAIEFKDRNYASPLTKPVKLSQRSLLELTTSADGKAISLDDLV